MAARKVTLEQVAAHLGGDLQGPGQTEITGLAEPSLAQPGELSFVVNEQDVQALAHGKASAVLIADSLPDVGLPMIRVASVPAAINTVLELFEDFQTPNPGIHASAVVDPSAELGRDVTIGPHVVVRASAKIGDETVIQAGCYIGSYCLIGRKCRLEPGAVVATKCRIGDRVILGQNAVIGSEGFGYRPKDDRNVRIPHLGAVCIADDVEIGACSCVDRAKFGFTVVGSGTKIDSLVHIAHNVKVGEHCLIAALTGIAGSAKIGNRVVFGGQVGVRDHAVIGDGVMAGARTAIHHDVPDGSIVLGTPALDRRQTLREQASLRKLPDLLRRVKKIEQRLAELDSSADNSERD